MMTKTLNNMLYKFYRVKSATIKRLIRKIVCRLEGGEYHSITLRRIMKDYHNVEVGMYSHGGCFEIGCVEPFSKFGRYCSIARSARIVTINHPMRTKSTHSFFWQSVTKICEKDLHEWSPINIENDVWIGHGAIVLPNVSRIGNGAVIAAGAIVNKDVPPYAIVVGNPARIVRYRFSEEVIKELLESKWWEKDIEELMPNLDDYQQDYQEAYYGRKPVVKPKDVKVEDNSVVKEKSELGKS